MQLFFSIKRGHGGSLGVWVQLFEDCGYPFSWIGKSQVKIFQKLSQNRLFRTTLISAY